MFCAIAALVTRLQVDQIWLGLTLVPCFNVGLAGWAG
jgi:ABC-type nickel/cobalt efflux system permease component RcnA